MSDSRGPRPAPPSGDGGVPDEPLAGDGRVVDVGEPPRWRPQGAPGPTSTPRPGLTFAQAAAVVLQDARASWATPGTEAQWRRAMEVHAAPFRDKPLRAVTQGDVAAALGPLWETRPAAAAKVRALWERVLAHPARGGAGAPGNPAAWSPALRRLLRPTRRTARAPAPFADLPLMLNRLRSGRGLGRWVLELSVLTCIPTPCLRRLSWSGLRHDGGVWTARAEAQEGGAGGRWRVAALSDPLAARLRSLQPAGARAADPVFQAPGRAGPLTERGGWTFSRNASLEAAQRCWSPARWSGPSGLGRTLAAPRPLRSTPPWPFTSSRRRGRRQEGRRKRDRETTSRR